MNENTLIVDSDTGRLLDKIARAERLDDGLLREIEFGEDVRSFVASSRTMFRPEELVEVAKAVRAMVRSPNRTSYRRLFPGDADQIEAGEAAMAGEIPGRHSTPVLIAAAIGASAILGLRTWFRSRRDVRNESQQPGPTPPTVKM